MQDRLFYEDVNEALREVVQALGGAKKVGPLFWPEKSLEQAQQLLLACLNVERKERLTPEQVLLLLRWGRAADCHAGMQFLAQQAGYDVKPVNPLDEQARLQRDFVAAVNTAKHLADHLERLTQPPLQAVK